MSHSDSPSDPVVVAAVRSPVGRYGGALAPVRPDDLAALVIREVVLRAGIPAGDIEDVIFGAANQAGEDNRNVARIAGLLAGLPDSVAGQTVNRLCGSGLQAIVSAAHAVRAGEGEVFVAGGVESMSRAPLVMGKAGAAWARDQQLHDTTLGWRFENPRLAALIPMESMGETGENVAEQHKVGRERQDEFALRSQQRWAAADAAGHFSDELIAVTYETRKGPVTVERDEHPRPDTTAERLSGLKPVFRKGGSVTAGNASGLNDGAAATVVTSRAYAERHSLPILGRVVAAAVAGVPATVMGLGPIPASRKALERAGIGVEDLAAVELNEAFAAQALACIDELGLDETIVNQSGGSIAMGHPLGSTGARLTATLLHTLHRTGGRYGLVTMCIGVGQGIACVFERTDQ